MNYIVISMLVIQFVMIAVVASEQTSDTRHLMHANQEECDALKQEIRAVSKQVDAMEIRLHEALGGRS